MDHGWVDTIVIWLNGVRVNSTAGRSQDGNGVIRRRVRNDSHGDEDDEQVEPHGEVGHPPVGLEGSDLGQEEADNDEENGADDIAQLELGDLRDVLTELDRDLSEQQQQTQSLHDVGDVAGQCAPGAETEIAIVPGWELVAVHAEEDAPDQVTRVAGHESENRVESDTYISRRVN